MNQLLKTSISDFKLVFRDPSLRVFLVIPFLALAIVNFLLPYLVDNFEAVEEYIPYVLMAATLQMATMFSFIYCIVLIEEKDTEVSKVYGVLPISKTGFISFRLMIPFFLSAVFTWGILTIQPFYQFQLFPKLVVSILAGLIAPLMALVVTVLSKNKMAGMTWYKLVNLLVMIPLVAFFTPPDYSVYFGIIPTHWIFQGINDMIFGKQLFWHIVIGFALTILLLAFFIKRFSKNHFA